MKRRSDTLTVDLFDERWAWLFAAESVADNLLASEQATEWTEQEILGLYEYILQDALSKLVKKGISVQTRTDIYDWIVDETDSNPFSFVNCCTMAGLDPEIVREGVMAQVARWRKSLH